MAAEKGERDAQTYNAIPLAVCLARRSARSATKPSCLKARPSGPIRPYRTEERADPDRTYRQGKGMARRGDPESSPGLSYFGDTRGEFV